MEDDNHRLDLSKSSLSSMASSCRSSTGNGSSIDNGDWDSDDYDNDDDDDRHGNYYYHGEMNSEFDEEEENEEEEDDDDDDEDNENEETSEEELEIVPQQPAEILEENNNDPNNNMDDENGGEENPTNQDVRNESELVFEEWEEMPVSPQPGCSKHFDAVENNPDNDCFSVHKLMNYPIELVEQANDILILVKKLTFESVINALNEKKGKQIFLTDLLPKNIQTFNKRHHSGDICDVNVKKQILMNFNEASTSTAVNNINSPEEVLRESKNDNLRLSPGLNIIVQEAKIPIVRNSIPISISSSDDDASPVRINFETINNTSPFESSNGLNSPLDRTSTENQEIRDTVVNSMPLQQHSNPSQVLINEFEVVLNETRKRNAQGDIIIAPILVSQNKKLPLDYKSGIDLVYPQIPSASSNSTTQWNVTPNSSETISTIPKNHTEIRPQSENENSYLKYMPSTSSSASSEKIIQLKSSSDTINSNSGMSLPPAKFLLNPENQTTLPKKKFIIIPDGSNIRMPCRPQANENCPGTSSSSSTIVSSSQHISTTIIKQCIQQSVAHIKQPNGPPSEKPIITKNINNSTAIPMYSRTIPMCSTRSHKSSTAIPMHSTTTQKTAVPQQTSHHPIIIDRLSKPGRNNGELMKISQKDSQYINNIIPPPEVINIPNDPVLPELPYRENQKYCKEIYFKLRAMFPKISSKYIQRYCPEDWNPRLTHDTELGQIVDSLFSREAEWEYEDGEIHEEDTTRTLDGTYEYLLDLFPDAEPGYMRRMAECYWQNEDGLKNFIESTFQHPVYPTREQYLEKLKLTEEQKKYTTNFDINYFLEIFPDPKKHFEDPQRVSKIYGSFDLAATECLKSIFRKHRVNTINRIYNKNNSNMSIAARILSSTPIDMKTSRCVGGEYPTANITQLQEMAYVKHRDEIEKHLEQRKHQEKEEFEKLKLEKKLIECKCCFDSECMPTKCSSCENGHIFCNSCISNGTNSRLGDGETHVPCFLACGKEFSLSTLQKVMKPTKFSILLKKRQSAEVMAAGVEGLVACPFCHFATIPPEGDKVFKCLNPDCMKESCIQCKEPNHVPLHCDEVSKADKTRKYIEEKMTEALSRRCHHCKKVFIKEEGCNKITCPCGAQQCYLCDQPIKDYSHFRGQGSDDTAKCPLHSDNRMMNYYTVKKVAEEVKKQLLDKDPTLIIDTDSMLPVKPNATPGPHQQITGDPNLAAIHAARVLGKRHL